MKIDIELIKVDEATRIRKDIGDLASLQESIQQVGLINPVLVDENYTLVAGFRRLSACKKLGLKEIETRVLEMGGDELKMLEAEVAENFYRKEFTPEEILSTERRRREIEEARRPKGVFERFWNWIKALFRSDYKPVVEAPANPAPVDPPQEPVQEAPEEPAPAAAQEPEEQPVPEPEPEPESEPDPATETTQTPAPSPQPKTAEIIERDGVRHIKWR